MVKDPVFCLTRLEVPVFSKHRRWFLPPISWFVHKPQAPGILWRKDGAMSLLLLLHIIKKIHFRVPVMVASYPGSRKRSVLSLPDPGVRPLRSWLLELRPSDNNEEFRHMVMEIFVTDWIEARRELPSSFFNLIPRLTCTDQRLQGSSLKRD